jgi:hypothetical protein
MTYIVILVVALIMDGGAYLLLINVKWGSMAIEVDGA